MTVPGWEGNGSERRIPLTANRAATAVVRSRFFVERARQEARTALDILSELDPQDRGERQRAHTMTRLIVEYLGSLSAVDPPSWEEGSVATEADPTEREEVGS